jgi:hypothetical protein
MDPLMTITMLFVEWSAITRNGTSNSLLRKVAYKMSWDGTPDSVRTPATLQKQQLSSTTLGVLDLQLIEMHQWVSVCVFISFVSSPEAATADHVRQQTEESGEAVQVHDERPTVGGHGQLQVVASSTQLHPVGGANDVGVLVQIYRRRQALSVRRKVLRPFCNFSILLKKCLIFLSLYSWL